MASKLLFRLSELVVAVVGGVVGGVVVVVAHSEWFVSCCFCCLTSLWMFFMWLFGEVGVVALITASGT